jgi:hypothetical protein
MIFFFKKEPSLFTWDELKIYESFSDSDKLLQFWCSLEMVLMGLKYMKVFLILISYYKFDFRCSKCLKNEDINSTYSFEGVLFRSDSRHNDRVDSLLECARATKQAVMTVAKWHRNQIIRGLCLLSTKRLKMDSCLRGAILNLTAFCSIWTLIECSSIN